LPKIDISLDLGNQVLVPTNIQNKFFLHFYPSKKGGKMTKAELIEKMAKDAGITKVTAKAALESFLDGVTKGLKKRGSRVTLVGFGTFKKTYRKTRMGRNPQTGEKIKIKGKNVVSFKAGKNLQ